MGRSRMWSTRVEWTVAGQCWTHTEWITRLYGRPTDANLARLVHDTVASFKAGGANAKAGILLGVPEVLAAQVVSQRSGKVLATYSADRLAS